MTDLSSKRNFFRRAIKTSKQLASLPEFSSTSIDDHGDNHDDFQLMRTKLKQGASAESVVAPTDSDRTVELGGRGFDDDDDEDDETTMMNCFHKIDSASGSGKFTAS